MFNISPQVSVIVSIFLLVFKVWSYYWNQWDLVADFAFAAATGIIGYYWNNYTTHYNEVCFVILENHTEENISFHWGDAKADHFGFGEFMALPPKQVVCRKVLSGFSKISGQRPCVRIAKGVNGEDGEVTIIVWDPNEHYHTKVFEITNNGIKESRNPEQRNWHFGPFKIHQSAE